MKEVGKIIGDVGLAPSISMTFKVERLRDRGLLVESISFDVDDYFPGNNGFGGRVELLSGVQFPACANAELVSGIPRYGFGNKRDPFDPELIACDSRWVPSTLGYGVWESLPKSSWITDPTQAVLLGNPGKLTEKNFSFYDFTSKTFHDSEAASFSGPDGMLIDMFAWNPLRAGFCLAGVFILSQADPAYSLFTMKTPNGLFKVHVTSGAIVTTTGQETTAASIPLSSQDVGIPVLVGLWYDTGRQRLETFVKRQGKSNPISVSSYRFPAPGNTTIEFEVLADQWERSVEVLEVALWREGFTDRTLRDTAAGYSKGYGL